MKLFFSEHKPDYSHYLFPYQIWLLKEEGDEVEKIYGNGFLPMRNMPEVYYLSRNIRVDLRKFIVSSENRRILKKTAEFESRLIPMSDFEYTPAVQRLCKKYSDEKFPGIFSAAAIKNRFSGEIYNYVFVFKRQDSTAVGYATCYISKNIVQYAYPFYDLAYLKDNLGARMMLESIIWGKENNKEYIYLGSCYEEKSLYKTEFSGVEFFNGFRWSENLEELRELIREGQEGVGGYDYLLKRKEFLEKFYEGDINLVLNNYGVRVKL